MGTNTLPLETDTTTEAEDWNQYHDAFTGDFVPRNASGVAENEAGALGTALLFWRTLFTKVLTIGTAADNFELSSDGPDLVLKQSGDRVKRFSQRNTVVEGDPLKDNAVFFDDAVTGAVGGTSFTDLGSTFQFRTNGGPVEVSVVQKKTPGSQVYGQFTSGSTGSEYLETGFRLLRGSTVIGAPITIQTNAVFTMGTSSRFFIPPGDLKFYDFPPAGDHTYKIQGYSAGNLTAIGGSVIVREII